MKKQLLKERFQQLAGLKPLYTLKEQNPINRDTSKDTTSGVFKVDVEVEDETTEVTVKYGHATGPVDDVTISWGNESHNVDFEAEDVIDDHGNEGKDMTFVAYSQDDKWRFIVDVAVGFNYEDSGEIYEVHWQTLEIDIDDAKKKTDEQSVTGMEDEDPRRPKDIEFDTAQAMSKLTPDDKDKVGDIQSMMAKERYLSPKGGSLEGLTFDMVVNIFSDDYKDVQFTRKQPDGEDGPYYRDSVTFPNTDDTLTAIGDMGAFEDWKYKTMERFGDVSIKLDPKASMWFDKVKILDDEFQALKDKLAQGKADAMKRDQELGRSID